jgi:hypothetical protein
VQPGNGTSPPGADAGAFSMTASTNSGALAGRGSRWGAGTSLHRQRPRTVVPRPQEQQQRQSPSRRTRPRHLRRLPGPRGVPAGRDAGARRHLGRTAARGAGAAAEGRGGVSEKPAYAASDPTPESTRCPVCREPVGDWDGLACACLRAHFCPDHSEEGRLVTAEGGVIVYACRHGHDYSVPLPALGRESVPKPDSPAPGGTP